VPVRTRPGKEAVMAGPVPVLLVQPSWADSRAVLALAGDIDLTTIDIVRKEVRRCLDERPMRLSLDLRAVTFCDAAGVHTLDWARRETIAAKAEFSLIAPSRAVMRVLTLAGATGLLSAVRRPPPGPSAGSQPYA
jgi:anti-sigma B factor antagonist